MAYGEFDLDSPYLPLKENGQPLDGLVFESAQCNPQTAPVYTVIKVELNRLNDNANAFISEFIGFIDENTCEEKELNEGKTIGPVTTATPPDKYVVIHARVHANIDEKIREESFRRKIEKRIVAGEYLEKGLLPF